MRTQAEAVRWMVGAIAEDRDDNVGALVDPDTGIANLTALAEAASFEAGHAEWLDEETHWVWDAALIAADRAGAGEHT